MSNKPLKIFVHSVDATGHLNSAIGMAQAMSRRGHDVVFVTNKVLKTKIEKFGLRTIELECRNADVQMSENPAEDYAKIFKKYGCFQPSRSIDQLYLYTSQDKSSLLSLALQQLIDFDPQIDDAIEREHPDCVLFDHVFLSPSVAKRNIPWIAIMSVAPLFLYPECDQLPPPMSGYTLDNRHEWEEFREKLQQLEESYEIFQNKANKQLNFKPATPLKRRTFYNISPILNIYQYPQELDYGRALENETTICRVDAFKRDEEFETFELPDSLKNSPAKLIYLSMGSMSSYDVGLMTRLTTLLSRTSHEYIVAKGPLGDKYELPGNMWGKNFLPQTNILPMVDLVITHGGNNTVLETFSCGKPMIVLPISGDQFENAQRLHDLGYGIRLNPYEFKDQELIDAVEKLLNNEELKVRLEKAKKRIESSNSKEAACERIEKTILNYKKELENAK